MNRTFTPAMPDHGRAAKLISGLKWWLEAFGKSLIERHRKVNVVLADELKPDGVHALAIEAHAPGE